MKEFSVPLIVESNPDINTTQLLVDRLKQDPNNPLFSLPDGDGWIDMTTKEFYDRVVALAKGFVASGVQPGEKIGLMAKTSFEWTLVDFAAWFAGAFVVPVYETSSPAQVQWILSDSEADYLVVESADYFATFDEVAAELPKIKKHWQLHLGDIDKLVASGKDIPDEEIERRRTLAKGSDIATIIYTSGSTGKQRGCILSHSNFVEVARNASASIPEVVHEGASTLLFVTLAHVYARFMSVLYVHTGIKVGHQADTTKLVDSLSSFKPTLLLAVPRVFEKVYNSAEQKAEAGGKGKIFRKAADTAVEYSKALDQGKVPLGLKLRHALFDALVYKKLRNAIGGRVTYAISGSAPLGLFLGHFYRTLGIIVMEGYGLTETTAPAAVNVPSLFKIGTVGKALPGIAFKIADDDEILVKGICVFQGYWKDEEQTAAAFDEDGWFKTGDLGKLDEDGYLTITGRKKEIIITAGGKNVSPMALEDPIRANPLVGQVVVVGDQKPFVAALITLDDEMLPVWLNNNGEDAQMTIQEAASNPTVLAELQRAVDLANTRVSRAESIRKFVVLPTQLTIESGHLTPKLSIRRKIVENDFADVIESIYNSTPPTQGTSFHG